MKRNGGIATALSAVGLGLLLLMGSSPPAAAEACFADIVSPNDGAHTTPAPVVKVKSSTQPDGCDPNWKEISIQVRHTGSGNIVYEFEHDRGASRVYSRTGPPFEHQIPEGELQEDTRYSVEVSLDVPTPFSFDTSVGIGDSVDIVTSTPLYRTKRQAEDRGGGPVRASYVSAEPDTNRPGSDYRDFDLRAPEPDRCANACEDDGPCEAYTYVPPGVQGPDARCWLKDGVPRARSNEGMVSGVKESPLPQNFNVNRGGSDYKDFDLSAADPSLCADACAGERQCQAYTYVPPGRQGPSARCWLKDGVPRASFAEGMVSGTK